MIKEIIRLREAIDKQPVPKDGRQIWPTDKWFETSNMEEGTEMKVEKTISLTNDELLQSQAALKRLGEASLTPTAAYWVGKTFKRVDNWVKHTSKQLNKTHHDLVVKYGAEEILTTGEAAVPTGRYQVLPENADVFAAAMI